MTTSYRGIMATFNARYDSPTRREHNTKISSSLFLASTRGNERDDHSALKALIEQIALLAPIAARRDCESEAKSRILLKAVSGDKWYFHAGSKLSYVYDFPTVVDAVHSFIRAIQVHSIREASTSTASTTLYAQPP